MPFKGLSFGKTLATLEIIYAAHPHLTKPIEINGYPCNVIGYQQYDLFANRTFALNRIFISANGNGTVKQNSQSDFKVFLT